MNELKNLVVAVDVDGVLSPVTPAGSGMPENAFEGYHYTELSSRNFGAVVADEVVALLKTLIAAGASVRWHTSWREAADEHLAPELGLPKLMQFAPDSVYNDRSGWWKLEAVKTWLKATQGTDQHLLWIDDDITDSVISGETESEVLQHPRLSIISPNVYWGLSPKDLETISESVFAGKRIAYVNNPKDPRPLPETPGSIIGWKNTDPDDGEHWGATATAIASPEGGVIWGDAFITAETEADRFSVEELNAAEWFVILETVPASEAPLNAQQEFAEGDTVLGAVFTQEIDGADCVFTTALGVYYEGEFADIYAVDPYGGIPTDSPRTAQYLPTVLL